MRDAIARDAEAAPPTGLKSDITQLERDLKLIKWMMVAIVLLADGGSGQLSAKPCRSTWARDNPAVQVI